MKKLMIFVGLVLLSTACFGSATHMYIDKIKAMRMDGFPQEQYDKICNKYNERYKDDPGMQIYLIHRSMQEYMEMQDLKKFDIEFKDKSL